MTQSPQAWWEQARHDLEIAGLLEDHGFHGSAVFHAWMSLELAIKAIRLAPARIADLDFDIQDLGATTVDELGGLAHKTGHNELLRLLNKPWHPKTEVKAALDDFAGLASAVGLEPDELYMACRYPDKWTTGPPYAQFTPVHAERAIRAAASFENAVRDRIPV
jgi:HEPN domain-containing protein